jgi:hypothetical protein
MLDKIRAIALEKLGSEEAADAFVEGFVSHTMEKSASFSQYAGRVMGNPNFQKVGFGLAASLVGAGIVKGFSSGPKAIEGHALRNKFDMALAQVMSTNKIVKGANPDRAKEYAETMFRFAPHVASDPNLLGSVLSNAIQGESVDANTIKMLVDLEGRYVDNNRPSPLLGIKS